MNIKKQNGITLTILVITIILIFIISGVSINIILGEKGLLQSTKETKDMQENYAIRQEERTNSLIDGVGTERNPNSQKPEESEKMPSEKLGYVTNNLILHYDGINNTGEGYNSSATVWKDLSGNNKDGTLNGCTWRRKKYYIRWNNRWNIFRRSVSRFTKKGSYNRI